MPLRNLKQTISILILVALLITTLGYFSFQPQNISNLKIRIRFTSSTEQESAITNLLNSPQVLIVEKVNTSTSQELEMWEVELKPGYETVLLFGKLSEFRYKKLLETVNNEILIYEMIPAERAEEYDFDVTPVTEYLQGLYAGTYKSVGNIIKEYCSLTTNPTQNGQKSCQLVNLHGRQALEIQFNALSGDSVAYSRIFLVIEPQGKEFQITHVLSQQKCWEGRGHQYWSAAWCT